MVVIIKLCKARYVERMVNMNPVLWILVILAAVVLWFIISFIFIPVGRLALKKWDKIMEILNNEEQKERENKDE